MEKETRFATFSEKRGICGDELVNFLRIKIIKVAFVQQFEFFEYRSYFINV